MQIFSPTAQLYIDCLCFSSCVLVLFLSYQYCRYKWHVGFVSARYLSTYRTLSMNALFVHSYANVRHVLKYRAERGSRWGTYSKKQPLYYYVVLTKAKLPVKSVTVRIAEASQISLKISHISNTKVQIESVSICVWLQSIVQVCINYSNHIE